MKRLVLPLALVLAACSEDPVATPPVETPPGDTTPAEIRDLTVSPARVGRGGTVTVTFAASEALQARSVRVAGRKTECVIEEAAATCTAKLRGDETEGPQTIDVFAMDLAGNQSTATATVTTDYTAPAINLDSRPGTLTNSANPSVGFSADEEGTTFTCSHDGGLSAACTSPFALAGLAEGPHTVYITATDPQGNARTAVVTFTVDLTAPETTLVTGIPALTRAVAHSVSFTSDDERASFECRLDAAAFAPCASPAALANLTEAAHTFVVRAVDEAGNADATPVEVAFTVDRTPPTTSVGTVPASGTADLTIPFTVNDAAATVDCAVDGGEFAPCTSPFVVTGLTDGAHTVVLRATDAAGNAESPPAVVKYTVDRTPPQTTIVSVPLNPTRQTSATFEFSATEAPNTFECRLDGAAFAACTTPTTVTVAHGDHVFEVRGADQFGNFDLSPARYAWTVDTVAPVVTFNPAPPTQHQQPTLTFNFEADEAGVSFECSLDGVPFATCESPHTLTGLTATGGATPPHVFKVRAVDPSGNTGAETTASFDVDLSAPPPAVPQIVPLLPSIITNTTPTLAWNIAENATAYDVQIATAIDFSSGLESHDDVVGTSFVVSQRATGKYFYRVRSKNSTGPSAWSQVHTIQVNPWGQVNPLPVSDALYGLACRTAAQCVSVGTASAIVRTMDGGKRFDLIAAPLTATTTFFGVAAADANTLVAVGTNGVILRSTDFGASWLPITTDADGAALPTNTWNSIHFNGSTGIITGGTGNLLLSTDAGASWRLTAKPVSSTFADALVVETTPELRLVAHTSSAAYLSTDGGATWTNKGTLSSAGDASLAPDGTLFIVGASSRIYRSTDKGSTWTLVNSTGPTIEVAHGIDANTLLVAGANSATEAPVRRASISGTTTTFQSATRTDSNSTLLTGLATVRTLWVDSNLDGFATGFTGTLWRVAGDATGIRLSTPAGVGGNQVAPTTAGYMRNFHFVDANIGFACGPGSATSATAGTFLKTTNGGRSWTSIDPDPALANDTFQDVHFFDELNGIGVGGASHIPTGTTASLANAPWAARTTDGGLTWTQLELPAVMHVASKHLRAVAFASPTVGFAVGDAKNSTENTVVLAWNGTTNRFDTMPVVDQFDVPRVGMNLFDVELFNATTGFAVGRGGIARLDATAGKWIIEYSTGTVEVNAVSFVDADTAVAVGKNGRIYRRSVDSFDVVQWAEIPTPNATTSELFDVAFYGQQGYIAGAGSTVYVSDDGGLTWTTATAPISTAYGILRKGTNEFFVGGLGREIHRTELLR